MRYLAIIGTVLLGSCATDGQGGGYARLNGRTNPDHLRLALAQCQGEAAMSPQGFWVSGGGWVGLAGNVMLRAAQEQTVTSGCMARYGYVVAQQPHPVAHAQAAHAQATRSE